MPAWDDITASRPVTSSKYNERRYKVIVERDADAPVVLILGITLALSEYFNRPSRASRLLPCLRLPLPSLRVDAGVGLHVPLDRPLREYVAPARLQETWLLVMWWCHHVISSIAPSRRQAAVYNLAMAFTHTRSLPACHFGGNPLQSTVPM